MREERSRRRGRGGKRKGRQFMDAAMDGYIRDMALDRWREVDDLISTRAIDLDEAVTEAGRFAARGPYQPLWEGWWRREVTDHGLLEPDNLMERIEAAVRGALHEESAGRAEAGQPTVEDTPHYIAFVGRAMNNLLEDSEGEIEEFEGEEL